MKAKRRIHKFNFDHPTMKSGEKTHVALVDQAANMTEALVMKSKYITQTTEVEEYNDDGSYSSERDTVRISDYGDGEVRIYTESTQASTQYVKVV